MKHLTTRETRILVGQSFMADWFTIKNRVDSLNRIHKMSEQIDYKLTYNEKGHATDIKIHWDNLPEGYKKQIVDSLKLTLI